MTDWKHSIDRYEINGNPRFNIKWEGYGLTPEQFREFLDFERQMMEGKE